MSTPRKYETPLDRVRANQAERATLASRTLLAKAGLKYEDRGGGLFSLDGFQFWPATGYWRSIDGRAKGYGCGALILIAKAWAA